MHNQNKRGELGETVTWMVATVIIMAVLLATIILSSAYPEKFKKVQEPYPQNVDILASKSMFSYLLTESDSSSVYEQIKAEEDLNDFTGNLGLKVFRELYQEEYSHVWLGILEPAAGNKYFGLQPSVRSNKVSDVSSTDPHIIEQIKLAGENDLQLLLIP